MHLGHISYPLVITSLIPTYLQLTTFTVQSLATTFLPPSTGHEDLIMVALKNFFMIMPVKKINKNSNYNYQWHRHNSKRYSVKTKFCKRM